jgi:threonine synthase
MNIKCTQCGFTPDSRSIEYCCQVCGGFFDFEQGFEYHPGSEKADQIGIWRFRRNFGLAEEIVPVSLGEGNTPLVWDEVGGKQVAFKLEYINPTGSYKDRGTTVLISQLHWLGVKYAIEDSSGNAGASFAAYCSRAGIHGKVYVPDYASGPKKAQIEAYGCEIVPVPGPRSNTSEAVQTEAHQGSVYASHVYQPSVLPGYATAAYEIYEQLGSSPGSVLVPAGQGSFLLGIARGFEALLKNRIIPAMPQMIGVQSQACAPLWAAIQNDEPRKIGVEEGETIAEGIRIGKPLRALQVLGIIKSSRGWISAVREGEILPAMGELARRGFYVEPTSAVVWAALMDHLDRLREPIVLVLTGSGLKFEGR